MSPLWGTTYNGHERLEKGEFGLGATGTKMEEEDEIIVEGLKRGIEIGMEGKEEGKVI